MTSADHSRQHDDVLQIPLNAFTDLVSLSLDEVTTESALEKIVRVARQTVGGADDVSITLLQSGQPSTIAFTGQLAIDLDESQYQRGYGPCLDAAVGSGICKIDDMRSEQRWSDYTSEAAQRGCRSSISVPLPQAGVLSGALNVYATRPDAFDDAACDIGSAFAAYAAVAVGNVHRYDTAKKEAQELQRAMQHRAVIEQAKGMIMMQRRCTADEAFQTMVALSQTSNVKLRDVAADLVQRASGQR